MTNAFRPGDHKFCKMKEHGCVHTQATHESFQAYVKLIPLRRKDNQGGTTKN